MERLSIFFRYRNVKVPIGLKNKTLGRSLVGTTCISFDLDLNRVVRKRLDYFSGIIEMKNLRSHPARAAIVNGDAINTG
jgi:hypothetical protein